LSNVQADVTERMGVDLAAIALDQPYSVPAPRPRPPAPPDAVALAAYAGRFEIAPGFVLSVKAGPEGLMLAGPDGAFLPMDDEGADRFLFRPLFVPVGLKRDARGRVDGLVWNGQVEARRVAGP